MILDIFREKNTEIVFSVLPAWEMFFSMHVLSNPEHHASRKKWAESKEKSSPDLTGLMLCLCIMIAFTVFLIRKAEEHNRETGELQFY